VIKLKCFSRLDIDIEVLKREIKKWREGMGDIEMTGVIYRNDNSCYAHIYYKEKGEDDELNMKQIKEAVEDSLVDAQFWRIIENEEWL